MPTDLFFLNAQNRSTVMGKECGLADIEADRKLNDMAYLEAHSGFALSWTGVAAMVFIVCVMTLCRSNRRTP